MGCGASKKYATKVVIEPGTFTMEKGFLDADGDGRPEVHLENYTPAGGTQSFTESPVCVTGVSGFLGGHVLAQLLDAGFKVHGTVRRDLADPRYASLNKLENLKLFKADLNDVAGWDEAVAGCEYVIHVAGPFTMHIPPEEVDNMVGTHMKGMEHVVGACLKAKVKRVVITSSIAAIINHSEVRCKTFTESDWNTESVAKENDSYYFAKTEAEKKARELATGTDLEVVSINPGAICGPVQDSYTKIISGMHLIEMMNGNMPVNVQICFPTVDVRDVAQAHLLAMQTKEATGRYLCVGHSHWAQNAVEAVRAHFGGSECPYPLPSLIPPDCIMHVAAKAGVDPIVTTKWLNDYLGVMYKFDTSKIQTELGMKFRSYESTWCDMADSLVKYGYTKDRKPKVIVPAEVQDISAPEPAGQPKFVVKSEGEGKMGSSADPLHHIMLALTATREITKSASPLCSAMQGDALVTNLNTSFEKEKNEENSNVEGIPGEVKEVNEENTKLDVIEDKNAENSKLPSQTAVDAELDLQRAEKELDSKDTQ